MKKLFLLFALLVTLMQVSGQVSISIDNSAPDPSAGLDINFSNKGFLPPRLTTAMRSAIANPATGLTIYNTDIKCLEFYTGAENQWICPCPSYGTFICTSAIVNGIYTVGTPLTASNTISVTVNVLTAGGFFIYTNNINGCSFSKRGTFTSIGNQNIVLNGSGSPLASGNHDISIFYESTSCSATFTTVAFMGDPCPNLATITDARDGTIYNTVQIGTQCWMKENMNIGTRIINTLNQTNNNIIEKYCYNNLDSMCEIYGGFYQWGEMVQYLNGAGNSQSWIPVPTGNVGGICPAGWHIPSNNEWTVLENNLGGFVAGGKLKEAGISHWNYPNTAATNMSGFTALPSGARAQNSLLFGLGQQAYFYTSTESNYQHGNYKYLLYNIDGLHSSNNDKTVGYSVRCLKD